MHIEPVPLERLDMRCFVTRHDLVSHHECELMGDPVSIGDHDLFRGLVVAQHVDEACLTPEGKIDVDKTDMLVFAEWGFWTAGRRIGEYARKSKPAEGKK